jgi:hypothetical protein
MNLADPFVQGSSLTAAAWPSWTFTIRPLLSLREPTVPAAPLPVLKPFLLNLYLTDPMDGLDILDVTDSTDPELVSRWPSPYNSSDGAFRSGFGWGLLYHGWFTWLGAPIVKGPPRPSRDSSDDPQDADCAQR